MKEPQKMKLESLDITEEKREWLKWLFLAVGDIGFTFHANNTTDEQWRKLK